MAHVLDADQLKTFVAIVESGSFTRAADMVRKTQSAVSMQMKRLEERVGRQLFARDGRQARLTEDGERLLDYARRIVRLNLECVSSFAEADLKGRVSLGVPDDYADRYLPEILARFARSNPKTEVTVICEPTPLLAARIETGDLDLAVVTHVENRKGSEIIRLEPLLWVTSARHDVHADDPIPLAFQLQLAHGCCRGARKAGQDLPCALFQLEFQRRRSRRSGGPRPFRAARKRGASRHADFGRPRRLPASARRADRPDEKPAGALCADGGAGRPHHSKPRQPDKPESNRGGIRHHRFAKRRVNGVIPGLTRNDAWPKQFQSGSPGQARDDKGGCGMQLG